jgi:hypothetical protein
MCIFVNFPKLNNLKSARAQTSGLLLGFGGDSEWKEALLGKGARGSLCKYPPSWGYTLARTKYHGW